MWADTEADTDFLNYSEVAELISDLVKNPNLLPLSVGVFGGWGIGKSTTLNLVESELGKSSDDFLVVRFDAWLYQDFDDARAALMSVIADALITASPPTLKEKARGLLKRVNKLRVLGLMAEGGAALLGMPTFGATARAIEGAGALASGKGTEEDKQAAVDATKEVKEKLSGTLNSASPDEPPQEITAFREDFGAILKELDKTLVVFIDNLDRCLPEKSIQTLEAIRLFLFLPSTAFIIAADEDMVRHAVAQHFNNPGERHVTDYLDKLIQMPIYVPRVGVLEVRAYLFLLYASDVIDEEGLELLRSALIRELQNSWADGDRLSISDILKLIGKEGDDELRAQLEAAERMTPMLAMSMQVSGNPRTIKRLLNVVRMRTSIAKKREMPLDEAVIAKLALLERCTDAAATAALHREIYTANDGKPLFLSQAEAAETGEAILAVCPESLQRHPAVVTDWMRLDPKLAGIDLRPAAYLARESVPLEIGSSALSPTAKSAFETLIETATLSSGAAKEAINSVEAVEQVALMDALIDEMRRHSEWRKVRADFRGAVLLARANIDTGQQLKRFISKLPNVPSWMNAMIKNDDWYKGE